MASIKLKFRPSTVTDREGTIYYQIIHDRKIRQLPTPYRVLPQEWDTHRSIVSTTRSSGRKAFILSIRERIRRDMERLARIDRSLSGAGLPYTADDIIERFNLYSERYSLFNYMEERIAALNREGKSGTAYNYRYALHSFRRFRDGEDVMLDSITPALMKAYETWLHARGLSPNSVSFYFRILRAVYNHAVDQEVIDSRNPFRKVYTGIGKTVKRALPLSAIRRIRELDLTARPELTFARDMFMMSFYLRGMSFVDMCFLRKSDLRNGHLTYRRRKTSQLLTIAWKKEMQEILDRYPETGSDFLLPIIRSRGVNERCVYRNAAYAINRKLKTIAELVGIDFPLTMYVARHSWASGARSIGIPLGVISEGMGHDSESTTRIYLASLDTSVVDNANSLIIDSL